MKNVCYAIDQQTGLSVSKFGDGLGYFVLDYESLDTEKPKSYHLEKIGLFEWPNWYLLKWTKKIPTEVKNLHRKFWGLKELS